MTLRSPFLFAVFGIIVKRSDTADRAPGGVTAPTGSWLRVMMAQLATEAYSLQELWVIEETYRPTVHAVRHIAFSCFKDTGFLSTSTVQIKFGRVLLSSSFSCHIYSPNASLPGAPTGQPSAA